MVDHGMDFYALVQKKQWGLFFFNFFLGDYDKLGKKNIERVYKGNS